MEALTACSVAALTIYDMCKALDRMMVIESVALWEKEGGKSGGLETQSVNIFRAMRIIALFARGNPPKYSVLVLKSLFTGESRYSKEEKHLLGLAVLWAAVLLPLFLDETLANSPTTTSFSCGFTPCQQLASYTKAAKKFPIALKNKRRRRDVLLALIGIAIMTLLLPSQWEASCG